MTQPLSGSAELITFTFAVVLIAALGFLIPLLLRFTPVLIIAILFPVVLSIIAIGWREKGVKKTLLEFIKVAGLPAENTHFDKG